MFLDFKENKIIAKRVNKEKNILDLKIIPELISSDARLGISGSLIELNQIFDKKKVPISLTPFILFHYVG